jgi:signal transduction histidine kinase
VSVLLIGTITGFGIWIYQSEIRHTERLNRRIDNLESRTYDDDIEFDGSTEWRAIGNALDRLSTTLARREQMLLVLNRFLRHNLRNDLNVAVGHAADIKREVTGEDEQRRAETMESAIDSVLSTADRVRLTERLIDPAATDDRPVDLVGLLTDRIEETTADCPALTVTLDAPEQVWVRGGETLSFAIEELLANVAAHSKPNPVARISVTPTGKYVTVRVADNGPGIHPDEAAVITGDQEITPLQHSSGLGLWLVNWIVRRHDGQLSIPETDDGTTVVITLPRDDRDETG